jgi:hypothetical protein
VAEGSVDGVKWATTNREVRARALPHSEEIRVTLSEFAILFGYNGNLRETEEAALLIRENEGVRELLYVIEEAMTYALNDDDIASTNWRKSSCRLAAIVAMEMEDSSTAMREVVGPFGESDGGGKGLLKPQRFQ